MTMKRSLCILVAIAAAWAPIAFAQDTVDGIEKAVVEKWDKLASLQAKLDLKADFPMNIVAALVSGKDPDPANKAIGKLVINGAVDYAKKDAVVCSRLELNGALNDALKASGLFVSDGAVANAEWTFFNKVDHKQIDIKSIVPPGGKALFDLLKKNFTLAAQKPEKVGDTEAYVLDATLLAPDPKYPVSKLRFFFAKDSGVLLKCDAYDALSAVLATLTASEIKLNQPIAPERFKYTPPAAPAPTPAPAPDVKGGEATPATAPAAKK